MTNINLKNKENISSATNSKTVTILTTNDIHGRFLQEGDAIDFSRLATLRKANPDWLMVDAGDATQGTPLAILNKGLDPIAIMNEVGYDILTIGNHEFDNITKDDEKCELDCIINKFNKDYISINVKNKQTGANYIGNLFQQERDGRYVVKEVNGLNLLFIGISTPDMSMDIERMSAFKIDTINEIVESVQSVITEVRQAKTIHAVIALSHLGTRGNTTSTLLANKIKDLDLIIDGHSHEMINCRDNDNSTLITQSGCYGKYVGQIILNFEKDKLTDITDCIYLNKSSLENYEQNEKVKNILNDIEKNLNSVFGEQCALYSTHTLWGGALEEERPYLLRAVNISRYAQTNMGDLTTQAMIQYIQNRKKEINDKITNDNDKIKNNEFIISAINGGGLRDGIPFGKKIRRYELFRVLPSHIESKKESGFSLFRINLQELEEILAKSISNIHFENNIFTTSDGRFLNLSGLQYTIVNVDNNLEIKKTAILDCPLDFSEKKNINFTDNSEYTVLFCTNKYLASGGDGYAILKNKVPLISFNSALFNIVGEFIHNQCHGKKFEYKMVSDNISYENFDFQEPSNVSITLIGENNQKLCKEVIIFCFNTKQEKQYSIVSSDSDGIIHVLPPEGNSILQIMALMPFNEREHGENLYGELYLHTYYSLKSGKNLTAQLVKNDMIQFPDKSLAIFHHELTDGNRNIGHYSNYLNYIDSNGSECTFLIFDGNIYTKYRYDTEFEQVKEIQYLTNDGSYKSFSLSLYYNTWGNCSFIGNILN